MSKKKFLRLPDDSSFCSQQCQSAYAKGLRRLTVADTAARIEHAVIISRSERETLVEIDCMAWNVGRLLLSPALCFPSATSHPECIYVPREAGEVPPPLCRGNVLLGAREEGTMART